MRQALVTGPILEKFVHLRTHGYTWGTLGAHLGHTWGTLGRWICLPTASGYPPPLLHVASGNPPRLVTEHEFSSDTTRVRFGYYMEPLRTLHMFDSDTTCVHFKHYTCSIGLLNESASDITRARFGDYMNTLRILHVFDSDII